jgi:uncharacterized lipoprotein YajG
MDISRRLKFKTGRTVVKKILVISVAALVLSVGCTHNVNIALRPDFKATIQAGNELVKVKPALQFFKGDFLDKRSDPTLLASFKQGMHSFELREERPVADALFEGLLVALTASGHTWNAGKEGEVKVNVTFINLQAARNAGFVKVGATSAVQIKVDFVDAKTGTIIYSNVYSGTDKRDQALVGFMGMVRSSIDASLSHCVQSVTDDAELAKALQKMNR